MADRSVSLRAAGTGVAAAAGLIGALTLLARIAGFVRTLVFADSVGAVGIGNVYQSINAVPNVFYEVAAGGVLAAVAVPLVAGHLGGGDRAAADRSTSVLLTWSLAVLVPVALLIWLAAPSLSRWLLGADDAASVSTGADMLRIFAPQVVLYGVGVVLTGHVQSHRRFLGAALAPLLSSLVVIATYLAYGVLRAGRTTPGTVPGSAVAVLAAGTTLGVVALSLPLLLPALGTGWRYRPSWTLPPGDGARSRRLAAAGLLALAAQSGAVLTTNWLANHRGGDGTFVVYLYVQAVYLLPYAVLAVPVATSALPSIAHDVGAGAAATGASRTVAKALRAVLALSAGGAAVLIAAAPAVQAFFADLDQSAQTATDQHPVGALAAALTAYAPGLLGFGAAALLTRAAYVRGHAVLAGAAVAVGWLVAALLPLGLLAADAGARTALVALGVASSVGMSLTALTLLVLLRRWWGHAATAGVGRTLLVAVAGLATAAVLGRLVVDLCSPSGMVAAVLVGVLGAVVTTAAFAAVLVVGEPATGREMLGRLRRDRTA